MRNKHLVYIREVLAFGANQINADCVQGLQVKVLLVY